MKFLGMKASDETYNKGSYGCNKAKKQNLLFLLLFREDLFALNRE